MEEFEDELSPREVEAFQSLAKELSPPGFLEDKTVRALKRSNLIRSSRTSWPRLWKLSEAAAAAAVLLAAGFVIGIRWKSQSSSVPTPMPEFVLLLRNSVAEVPIRSEADELERVKEYSAWSRNPGLEGKMLDGEKLTDETRTLNVIEGQPIVSIADAEARKTAIAGYFLIRARDFQEAISIAQSCPHAKYGGTIEIRQIDPVTQKSN